MWYRTLDEFVSQTISGRFVLRRAIRKWSAPLPHGSMDGHAIAGFFMLRAHAAEKRRFVAGFRAGLGVAKKMPGVMGV
jgi:hypothetical protein